MEFGGTVEGFEKVGNGSMCDLDVDVLRKRVTV